MFVPNLCAGVEEITCERVVKKTQMQKQNLFMGNSRPNISSWQACSLPWHRRKQAGCWFSSSPVFFPGVAQWKPQNWLPQPRKTTAHQNVALPQDIWLSYNRLTVFLSLRHTPQTLASDRRTGVKTMKFKCVNVTYDHNSWNARRLQVVKIVSEGTSYK